tara:strand:+ start:1941 stop:2450 length:510 start_codon:yes stop_codon:yes gene_type:complete
MSGRFVGVYESDGDNMEKATFAAGCFWGVEAAFRRVDGVSATTVGFMGGTIANPSYEDVCHGNTGHAEVVQIEFDPDQVTYGELLELFWDIHDPTTLNRQGPDVGTQYRSEIFVYGSAQDAAARLSRESHSQNVRDPIVTEVTPATTFYRAEEYHQCYFDKQRSRHKRS